jgi:adenine C2-methylase RlmN of 23S rRNA A2503 and tRNA A37
MYNDMYSKPLLNKPLHKTSPYTATVPLTPCTYITYINQVSTVGVTPRIRKLADEGMQLGLAVSLHQTTDAKRSPLMPVNEK